MARAAEGMALMATPTWGIEGAVCSVVHVPGARIAIPTTTRVRHIRDPALWLHRHATALLPFGGIGRRKAISLFKDQADRL
jgi:hypothetical protein